MLCLLLTQQCQWSPLPWTFHLLGWRLVSALWQIGAQFLPLQHLFIHLFIYSCSELVRTSIAQWRNTGLLVKSSSNRSCTRGMIHNKIHLFSPDYRRPSIALQFSGLKHKSFHFMLWTESHLTITHQGNLGWGAYPGVMQIIIAENQTPDPIKHDWVWYLYQLGHLTPIK